MHELAVTQELIDLACSRAAGSQIKRLVVEIGKLSCVLPDAMRFWFEMCRENTLAAAAALEIIEKPGLGRCRLCQSEVLLESAYAQCICGSSDLEWICGDELTIKELEVL